jgi:type I restriction enzyme M protein
MMSDSIWAIDNEKVILDRIDQDLNLVYENFQSNLTYDEFALLVISSLSAWKVSGYDSRSAVLGFLLCKNNSVPFPVSENSKLTNLVLSPFKYFKQLYSRHINILTEILDKIESFEEKIGENTSFNYSWFNENLDLVFERWLEQYALSSRSFTSILPKELTKLIIHLLGKRVNQPIDVFSPFAGLNSFYLSFGKDVSYYSQEIDKQVCMIATMRLMAHDKFIGKLSAFDELGNSVPVFMQTENRKTGDFKKVQEGVIELPTLEYNNDAKRFVRKVQTVTQGDSILDWPQQKFDLILSALPLNVELSHDLVFNSIEEFVLNKSMDSLKSNGIAILVVTNSFEHSNKHKKTRKWLVESGYLQHVISFPSGIFPNTQSGATVLVLKKRRTRIIEFTDVGLDSNMLSEVGSRKYTITDEVLRSYKSLKSSIYRRIHNDDVEKRSFKLTAKRYVIPKKDKSEGVSLRQLVSVRKRIVAKTNLNVVISAGALSQSIDRIDSTHAVDVKGRRKIYIITEPCIILSLTGEIRARYISESLLNKVGSVGFTSDLLTLNVIDEYSINPIYLVYKLNSEQFANQKFRIEFGNYSPRIRSYDLLDLRIALDPKDSQEALAKEWREDLERSRLIQNSLQKEIELLRASNVSVYSEIASFLHSLGPHLASVAAIPTLIQKSLDGFIYRDELDRFSVDKTGGLTLSIISNEMGKAVESISSLINSMKEKKDFLDYPLVNVSITETVEFIETLSFHGKSFNRVEKSIDILNEISPDENGDFFWKGNLELLEVILMNILKNSDEHGFSKSKIPSDSRYVSIELAIQDEFLILRCGNNGDRFPLDFSKEDYITLSRSSKTDNTGIGGYDINRIATYFGNPNWQLLLSDRSDLTVVHEFTFKLNDYEY